MVTNINHSLNSIELCLLFLCPEIALFFGDLLKNTTKDWDPWHPLVLVASLRIKFTNWPLAENAALPRELPYTSSYPEVEVGSSVCTVQSWWWVVGGPFAIWCDSSSHWPGNAGTGPPCFNTFSLLYLHSQSCPKYQNIQNTKQKKQILVRFIWSGYW